MGRYAAALIVSALAVWWPASGAAATASAVDTAAADAADAAVTPTWSPAEISRHMNQLESITDPQAKTNEFLRILLATMSVQDPAARATLLERLRPHFAPLGEPAVGAVPVDPAPTTDDVPVDDPAPDADTPPLH